MNAKMVNGDIYGRVHKRQHTFTLPTGLTTPGKLGLGALASSGQLRQLAFHTW